MPLPRPIPCGAVAQLTKSWKEMTAEGQLGVGAALSMEEIMQRLVDQAQFELQVGEVWGLGRVAGGWLEVHGCGWGRCLGEEHGPEAPWPNGSAWHRVLMGGTPPPAAWPAPSCHAGRMLNGTFVPP